MPALPIIGKFSPCAAAALAVVRFTSPRPIPHPGWERELMARGQALRFAGGTAATRWGDEKAPAVLLAHGWLGRGAQLGKLVEPLLERGFQVVAWDAPAHGDSRGTRANLRLFAEGLADAARETGPFAGVIAHSFGAGATVFAIGHGWLKTERLVFAAAPASLDWVVDGYVRMLEMSKAVETEFRRQLDAWVGYKAGEMDVANVRIETPTLVVHDPLDDQVPFREAERIARAWPNAQLMSLGGVGHSKILKDRNFVRAAVDFVSEKS